MAAFNDGRIHQVPEPFIQKYKFNILLPVFGSKHYHNPQRNNSPPLVQICVSLWHRMPRKKPISLKDYG